MRARPTQQLENSWQRKVQQMQGRGEELAQGGSAAGSLMRSGCDGRPSQLPLQAARRRGRSIQHAKNCATPPPAVL